MQPCTIEDTPVGSYVYNIFVVQRKQVDANFYERYQVYHNLCVHDQQQPAKYLAIRVADVAIRPEDEQLRIHDFINLLMEQHLPETRLTAAN